ncbi:MAG: glycosyltransferase [Candidatus Omnitrophica bacterium]|nr:glycosyltransferase [Candidatus Omnitrophota bacterium]
MPKISVIIPAYNASQYIEKCLLSLKKQIFRDFETIVVDDCSSDETFNIASKYAQVVRLNKNSGEGAARNAGAKAASGEILVFSDADVVFPQTWLLKISERFKDPAIKCVGGGYCGSIGDSFIECFAFFELCFRRRNFPDFVETLVSNNFGCYRDIFFESGGFPEQYKCEDLRLSFEISKKYSIFWDKNNGVYHHFRSDKSAYFKQQFYFSRDTVWTYYQCPKLFFHKTHQGRMIHLEVLAIIFLLLFLFIDYRISVYLLIVVFLINAGYLIFLWKNKLNAFKSLAIIILRDLICSCGIFFGILLIFKDLGLRFFKSRPLNKEI